MKSISHPKKEPKTTARVFSSKATDGILSVSGMSGVDFLAVKNAWKKMNL